MARTHYYKCLFSLLLFLQVSTIFCDLVPRHIYLSLTGDPTSIQITFTTSTQPQNAILSYWEEQNNAKKLPVTEDDVHPFERPKTGVVEYISSITLSSLNGSTAYSYQIIVNPRNTSTWSQIYEFKTLPTTPSPVSLCIFGDMGSYGSILMHKGAGGLVPSAQSRNFDFIIHNGDIAYNLGTNNGTIGDDYMNNIQPASAIMPYMFISGNHEYSSPHDTIYYQNLFLGQTQLGTQSQSKNPLFWYSFDAGYFHISVVNSEVYCENSATLGMQYQWLDADLAAAKSNNPNNFFLVVFHRHVYNGDHWSLDSLLMRNGMKCTNTLDYSTCNVSQPCTTFGERDCGFSLQSLFVKYNVDIVVNGHKHYYCRHYPISPYQTYETQNSDVYYNPQNPVYIISGAAGIENTPSFNNKDKDEIPSSPSVASSFDSHSYSILTAHNYTHFEFKQIHAKKNAAKDQFWIIRDPQRPAWTDTEYFEASHQSDTVCSDAR
eukprot:TRINITY_DN103_c0_g1_i3.p1 TRINITY_DN103_c0_g1~~TRINITY_DN103_c0_g1_i3.p1  ORF type:complete len:489 (+),score=76.52 TRINITY_DN103_c0_g1_i3:118-1584(+)